MGKLTDEDVERLLRETFADKEDLVDELPQAIKPRRHLGPTLIAAAAVLVVLAGVLYGVSRGTAPEPGPPVATSAATDDGDIWGTAIVEVIRTVQPRQGWATVQVTGQVAAMVQRRYNGSSIATVKFSGLDKERIGRAVGVVAPVEWDRPPSCGLLRVANVAVGAITDKGDHKEVGATITYPCGHIYLATYRVEKVSGTWRVTGTVGQPTGIIDSKCALAESAASPQAGC